MKTILLAGVFVAGALAQNWTEPPPLIQLHRLTGTASPMIRRYADATAAVNVVGMTSITGQTESWLVAMHDSFRSIEDVDKTVHPPPSLSGTDEVLDQPSEGAPSTSRSMIASYRPAWSYRPDQAIQMLRKARYCQLSIYRIRPGTEADFAELVKSRSALFDSINLDRPEIAYHVISGAPSETFLFLAPLASLKILDDGLERAPAHAEGRAAAVKAREFTREHLLFRIEPAMSWVSDDFASADPEFWRGKAR
ncbi:MAG: hypothetical protein ABSH32_03645 [Bryobacteraceae bacterium]|jgi:hypothetical protein